MIYTYTDVDGDAVRIDGAHITVASPRKAAANTACLPDDHAERVAMAAAILHGTGVGVVTPDDDQAAAEAWERGAEAMRRVAAYYLDTVELDTYADAVRALPTPPPGATADPAAVLCGAPDGEGVCGFPAESRPCPVHDTPAGRAALSDDELAAVLSDALHRISVLEDRVTAAETALGELAEGGRDH